MAVHYRTQGFFIKKADRGEDSRLFTVYTKDFGKLKILGRAIRRIRSKLKSGAENFCLSEIEFIQGKSHKTLTDAVLLDNFSVIRKDLKKLKIVHQSTELLDEFIKKYPELKSLVKIERKEIISKIRSLLSDFIDSL